MTKGSALPLRAERTLLILLCGVLFLSALGSTDLWAPDEPTFAQAAREMIEGGQWIIPHVNGRIFEDKPPLLFWLISLASIPAGSVGSWSARLPSALAGIVLVLLTFEIGRRLAGRRHARLAVLILATCWMTFDKARSAQTDMLLAACVTGALWCLLLWMQDEARGSRAGFWLFCALGTLAKGPVGLILPVGIGALWLLSTGGKQAVGRFITRSGPLLFAGLIGGWAVAASLAGAPEGYDLFATLREQAFVRFFHGRHHAEEVLYFFSALPRGLLPWSLLLPGAILVAWRDRRGSRGEAVTGPLCWFLFTFGFFTISTEKRDLYLLPLYPAFALLAANLLLPEAAPAAQDQGHPRRWSLGLPLAITSLLLLVLGLSALFLPDPMPLGRFFPDISGYGPDSGAAIMNAWSPARFALIIAGAGALAALLSLRVGRPARGLGFLAGATAVSYLAVACFLNPALDPLKSARPLTARIEAAARSAGSNEIVAYGLYRPGFSFYSSLRFIEAWDPGDLKALLRSGSDRLVLAQGSDLQELHALPGLSVERLEQGWVGHRGYVLMRVRIGKGDEGGPKIALGDG